MDTRDHTSSNLRVIELTALQLLLHQQLPPSPPRNCHSNSNSLYRVGDVGEGGVLVVRDRVLSVWGVFLDAIDDGEGLRLGKDKAQVF